MEIQTGMSAPEPSGSDARYLLFRDLPVGDGRLELAGVSTAVLQGGDGPPLILLHGQGEFAGVWTRVIPDLVKDYRVIAPDLPAHGASEIAGEPPDADAVLRWLDELIDATCIEPPVLVGHLLGGALALRYAVEHGDRLSHLVLVDSLGLSPYRPSLRFAIAMAGFMVRPNERTQERLFRGCFADLDDVRDGVGQHWDPLASYALERARTPELQVTLRRLMPQLALRRIASEDLGRITAPTTLIWGRYDLQVRLAVAEDASKRFGWPLHVIDGAGDDPAIEQPAAFLRALYTAIESSVNQMKAEVS